MKQVIFLFLIFLSIASSAQKAPAKYRVSYVSRLNEKTETWGDVQRMDALITFLFEEKQIKLQGKSSFVFDIYSIDKESYVDKSGKNVSYLYIKAEDQDGDDVVIHFQESNGHHLFLLFYGESGFCYTLDQI